MIDIENSLIDVQRLYYVISNTHCCKAKSRLFNAIMVESMIFRLAHSYCLTGSAIVFLYETSDLAHHPLMYILIVCPNTQNAVHQVNYYLL